MHINISARDGGTADLLPTVIAGLLDKIAEIIAMVIESEENVETARKLAAELTEKYPLC